MIRTNKVLDRLRNGKYVVFFNNTPFITPKLVEMGGLVGLDGVWIDMEHQDFHYHDVSNMCLACRATGMEPMVRIRKSGDHSVYRAFECGATGIMVPHIKSAEEAKWVVRNAKFHPEGLRGLDCAESAAGYGMIPAIDYIQGINQETFIVLQIEDREALDQLDEIAAVPGVDVLFLGAMDLSQSLGISLQLDHSEIINARKRVAEAARRHGKWWGCPASAEVAEKLFKEEGATFFAGGAVLWFALDGLRKIRNDFTRLLGE